MATNPLRLSINDLPAHLATLKAELKEGHAVELVSGEDVIGELRAPATDTLPGSASKRPDFAAQLKQLWGDRTLNVNVAEWIREDRDA